MATKKKTGKKRGRKSAAHKAAEAKLTERIARIQRRIDGLGTPRPTIRQRVTLVGRCMFRAFLFLVLAVLLTAALV